MLTIIGDLQFVRMPDVCHICKKSVKLLQIDQIEPDLCILRITDVIMKDAGLYSISARNIAGSISTSVALHVEEEGSTYADSSRRSSWVKTRTKPFDELYDLGDELGRGTQGIVHHVVERSTGK